MTLKEKLLTLDIVEDNEYLDKYVELIENNTKTKREKFKTQRHHIVPKSYFKLNNLRVDNSSENLVNLLYKDHVLAHLYLSLCSSNSQLAYDNFVSTQYMLNKLIINDLEYIQDIYEKGKQVLSKNNCMYDEQIKKNHLKAMRSDDVKSRISQTMKTKKLNGELFSSDIRKKISQSQKELIYIYKDKIVTRVKPINLEAYLDDGWKLYEKRTYAQRCGKEMFTPLSDDFQRDRFNTRGIGCYCIIDSGERFEFKTIRDATIWWYENYKPFDDKYSEATFKRKILASIRGEEITYLPRCNSTKSHTNEDNNIKLITNIKWYRL